MKSPQLAADALWKRRFFVPPIALSEVAGNTPERGIAITIRGSYVPQIFAWMVETGELRQLTHAPDGIREGWIAPDGRYVYFFQDKGGTERGHIMQIPFEGGEVVDVTPDLEPYVLRDFCLSGNGRMLALNPINTEGFQVYVVPLAQDGQPGTPRRLHQSKTETWKAQLSFDGDLVAVQSTARAQGMRRYSTLVYDTASGDVVGELWDGAAHSVEPIAFAPGSGDTRLLATSTRSGYRRSVIWDPRTGEREDLDLPGLAGDVMPLDWSPDGQRILLNLLSKAVQHLYIYDLESKVLIRLEHPNGAFGEYGGEFGGVGYFGSDDEIFVHWQDATHPPQLIALDSRTGAQSRVLLNVIDTMPGRPWQSITFTSSDGQEVQGWLSTPEGEGPFPTILAMHGGPHAVITESFDAMSQIWTDHGMAYCTINFRGSTTFGRPFQEQIWGDLGHWEIEDMVAARDWLVEAGVAQPDAILLNGASYGGYLTLMGLGKRPDLWAGGIALVAIADWTINYEDASEAMKGAFRAWFAGASPDDNPEQYAKSSPITYTEHIKAPVLVIQGKNDTRTAARQMEAFERKMRDLGKDIEVLWFEAGHKGPTVMQIIEFYEHALRFAERVLGKK